MSFEIIITAIVAINGGAETCVCIEMRDGDNVEKTKAHITAEAVRGA